MNQYEAMFLFDPTFGSSFENCEREIQRLLERAGAEIVFCRMWDERRLAYKIKGRKRGTYVLVYFKAKAERIAPLERDIHISENVLRALILRADHVTPDMMERAVETRGAETSSGTDGDDDRSTRSQAAGERHKPARREAAEVSSSVAVKTPAAREVESESPDSDDTD